MTVNYHLRGLLLKFLLPESLLRWSLVEQKWRVSLEWTGANSLYGPHFTPYLILLLLHLCQQKLRIDVALLKQMLEPLEPHVMRVPLPRLPGLMGKVESNYINISGLESIQNISDVETFQLWWWATDTHLYAFYSLKSIPATQKTN